MQPLVQSAIDAANRGENKTALELCRQALAANPNDIDAWLVTAAVVEQPERKRQCLNRVLALDPNNQIARDELFQMDHPEMEGETPIPSGFFEEPYEEAPASEPDYPVEPSPASLPGSAAVSAPSSSREEPQVVSQSTSRPRSEKLVFKYPVAWSILVYSLIVLFSCAGLLIVFRNVIAGLLFFVLAVFAALATLLVSSKVELNDWGLRVSNLLSRSEVKWSHIKSIKVGTRPNKLELLKGNGQIVKIPAQLSGYSRLLELIRQKRPDLFETDFVQAQET